MNNKTNIEEDIKIVNQVLLHNRETKEVRQAIENILADRERLEKENMEMKIEIAENVYFGSMPLDQMRELQAKANKYDSLVEKIKDKIEWLKENILENEYAYDSDKDIAEYQVNILQELLDTEK